MTSVSAGAPQRMVQQLLCCALADPASLVEMSPRDLDLILRVARRARLLGRLGFCLDACGLLETLPSVSADQLRSATIAAQAEARAARWELDRIAWALSGMGDITLVALKGCAYLLAGTPNAGGRTFADVDLLVPEDRLGEVEERLLQRGWRTQKTSAYDKHYYRAWAHELPPLRHVERGADLDLHHSILMRTARLKPSANLLIEAARESQSSRIKVLGPVDMALHAMVHLFYGGELADALRELVDIDDLLRHFAATEPGYWEQFWPRVDALDLARPAFYGLRYARQLLGTPVPEAVLEASMAGAPPLPALWLMDWLVPRALLPRHPDARSRFGEFARLLLYMRSHWLKMPPLMLARHLVYKFYVLRIKRVSAGVATQPPVG